MRYRSSRHFCLVLIAMLVYASSSVWAGTVGTVKLTQYAPVNPTGGGPFKVEVVKAINEAGANYSTGADKFRTFCIEYNEHFSPGTEYAVKIDTKAAFAPNANDTLQSGTALLFSLWSKNQLGSAVAGFDGTNANHIFALQYAIWKLQGTTGPGYPAAGAQKTMMDSLITLAGSATGSLYNVRVMQLWDKGTTADPGKWIGVAGHQHQDQLIMVVPTPTASLAGGALLGTVALTGWLRRRSTGGLLTR